jgi:hypothetical protein
MSPSEGAATPDIGPDLIKAGCCQGALLDLPARMLSLARTGNNQELSVEDDNLGDALLVVVSQDCDIYAPLKAEPRVEAMTARWTKNASEIHTARKGNSARLFLLQESAAKALLADARRRVHIDKRALVGLSFTPAFRDRRMRPRFARWLAGRYDRPALPNEHVDAIQKPIVAAVDALASKNKGLLGLLDRVAELRFSAGEDPPVGKVHFIAMTDDGDELTAEEEAEIGGWLDNVLVAATGPIKEIALAFRTESTISLRDYLATTHLQLDRFSPEGEAETGSAASAR